MIQPELNLFVLKIFNEPGGIYVDVSTPTQGIKGSFTNEAKFREYLDKQHAKQNFENKYAVSHAVVKDYF